MEDNQTLPTPPSSKGDLQSQPERIVVPLQGLHPADDLTPPQSPDNDAELLRPHSSKGIPASAQSMPSLSSPELLTELKAGKSLRHVRQSTGLTTVFSGRGRTPQLSQDVQPNGPAKVNRMSREGVEMPLTSRGRSNH
ncbi:espin-like [Polypterus senegalus]|uniref:espin-like n=1 Tax=Polypterus senegalus TaxID=55291 RepID=UPI001965CF8F|nr:espin-like [Polypterus senegalus]XP_039603081.1 espin-like [Polypterus senegalus]XP_039603082.1 espin-like [Polypterus senegalus]XP_039603083.1 espin-like [Polypterus senegalus]XP_039603084.1 espin-like [Polypterus senegalus]XP_039603086.1 espin-like [Polypterus senegalus]XP_039603087.1 espin-like [Polypterus senegalus]XP_039603088.1 espin-like [Polypterus senegalus]XP_039603089.1 espin-like [Polypterus senegalus]XP_039603090.1 espin-like [Polypterus senegalus]XP_039603091.1 espin-like